MRKTLIAAVCIASVLGVSAGPAFAGEATGSNKGGPGGNGVTGAYANANSLCAFSGLEDNDGAGTNPSSGETQNWGHVKKELLSFGFDVKGANDVGFPVEEGCNARDYGRKGG